MEAHGFVCKDGISVLPNSTCSSERSSGRGHRPMFVDAEAEKLRLREQISQPAYSVENHYHNAGFAQWLARNPRFESVTQVVILLNSIWIAIDTDYNKTSVILDAAVPFQIGEHIFCCYFLYEWTIRFLAFKKKGDCLRDCWFLFDSLLVGFMVGETWIMGTAFLVTRKGGAAGLGNASVLRMARLLRLTRMARMARLLRTMPELMILVKGMLASTRSVVYTLGLVLVVIYAFAICFTQLCTGVDCESTFPNVLQSMQALLLNGALMNDLGALVRPLEEQGLGHLMLLYCYILLSALTLMNMLVGVICEVVSAVAAIERVTLTFQYVGERMKDIMRVTDGDDNGKISKAEFMQVLKNKEAVRMLTEVGVDVVGLIDYVDTIFGTDNDGEELDFSDFVRVILDLRGTNPATVKDIIQLRKSLSGQLVQMEERLIRMTGHPGSPGHMETARKTQWQCSLDDELGKNGDALNQLIVFHEQELARLQEKLGELRLHLQQQDFHAQKQTLACSNEIKSGRDLGSGASLQDSTKDSKENGQSVYALLAIASDLASQAEDVLGVHHPYVPMPSPTSMSDGITPRLAAASNTLARSPMQWGSTDFASEQHNKSQSQRFKRGPQRNSCRHTRQAWSVDSEHGKEHERPSTCS